MVKLKIRHGIGGGSAIMPAGLILGVAPGALAPAVWQSWTAANNFFLKGTDSDALVNTQGARTSLVFNSTSNGGHNLRNDATVNYGLVGRGGSSTPASPSADTSNQGSHNHVMRLSYRPAACNIAFVKAQQDTPLFDGAMFFSAVEQPDHQGYANNLGLLALDDTVGTGPKAEEKSGSVDSRSAPHDHITSASWPPDGISGGYSSAGGSTSNTHDHEWSPTIAHNIRHALMRVYQAVDLSAVDFIIGIWDQSGVPDGWEVVAELVNNYLSFDNTIGDGSIIGDNTLLISGNTASGGSHGHPRGSYSSTNARTTHTGHTSGGIHNHTPPSSRPYEPEHYYVKFIRKLP